MKVANLIGYNAVYWSIVYFDNKDNFFVYIFVFLLFLFLHFFIAAGKFKLREFALICSVALAGVCFDLFLEYLNVFKLLGHTLIWLPVIWMAFAMTFNFSFAQIFQQRKWLLFFLGAVFGPLAYFSAGKFQLLSYSLQKETLLIHALAWGALMIILKILREKINENIK